MYIHLQNTGKRFNNEWIFRHLSYTFQMGETYALCGPNGSGKSTLLQLIAGAIMPNEGSVSFSEKEIPPKIQTASIQIETDIFSKISFVAPYLELIEEMSATEFLNFHAVFKPMISTYKIPQILKMIGLENTDKKQIRFFSSGMKQRLKLAQGFFSDVPVLLLDEPCTNLDDEGYALYYDLVQEFMKNKILIIGSNDKNEFSFCKNILQVLDYKKDTGRTKIN
ncbi:MAG: ATP-binding cassette domain-containing protein [Bacteroidetes bacterium]|nr:ATP-binding cassette domain-containing protein [Bacteroidota bacterium]